MPIELLNTQQAVRDAIHADEPHGISHTLRRAAPALRDDPAFVWKLVHDGYPVLADASERLLRDRAFVLRTLRSYPESSPAILPTRYRNDPQMRAAVAGPLLEEPTDHDAADRALLRAAVAGGNPDALKHAAPKLQNDAAFMRELIAIDYRAAHYTSGTWRNDERDPRVIIGLARAEPLVLRYCSDSVVAAVAKRAPAVVIRFRRLEQQLRDLHIDEPERLGPPATRASLLANRAHTRVDGRPLLVVVMTRHDDNNVFNMPQVDKAMLQRYRVMYYEASSAADFSAALREASALQPVSALVIAGHGTPTSLRLGPNGGDDSLLTVDTVQTLAKAGLSGMFVAGARIVLNSCLTGEGGAGRPNLANAFAAVLPHASVVAPMVTSRPISLAQLVAGKPFVEGESLTYRVTGHP